MPSSTILDIAIGLVFIYLLLSLLVTASSEMIASWLKRRQYHLWQGMVNLLGEDLAAQLYDHPVINGLTPPASLKWSGVTGPRMFIHWLLALLNIEAAGPSYIPARSFAVALLDLVGFKPGQGLHNNLRRALDGFPDTVVDARALKNTLLMAVNTTLAGGADAVREFQGFLLTIPDTASFAAAQEQLQKFFDANPGRFSSLKNAVAAFGANVAAPTPAAREVKTLLLGVMGSPPAGGALGNLLDCIPDSASAALVKQEVLKFLDKSPLEDPLGNLPVGVRETDLAKCLQLLWDEAGHDLETFKGNLETWFNESMDRVSGWYKRETQLVNLALAVILTLALNVDTIVLVNSLAKNSALRDSLVAQAGKIVEQPPAQLQLLHAGVPDTNTPNAGSGPQATDDRLSLVLSPSIVPSGEDLKGILTLRETNTADLAIKVTWSPTNLVSLPSLVTLKAGQRIAEFDIQTQPMANAARVDIRASNRVATLQLLPSPQAQFRTARADLDNLNLPISWVWDTNKPSNQAKQPPGQTNKLELSATASDTPGAVTADEISTASGVSSTPPFPAYPDRNHQLFLVVPTTKELLWNTITFHLLGWLLTAIAVSLGAPFWFDLLDKFINIRSSGGVPAQKTDPSNHPS